MLVRNNAVRLGLRRCQLRLVQRATRISKSLHRELRLHCVTVDTSVMDFVVKAIEDKLAGSGGRPAKVRGKKT